MTKLVETATSANASLARVRVPPLDALNPRLAALAAGPDQATCATVARILADVRAHGDAALERFQRAFDHVSLAPRDWEVPRAQWDAALDRLAPAVRAALTRAAVRVRAYHERQRESGFASLADDGTRVGMRVLPLDRVGLYVPGGQAAYPSSVLMNGIPAAVAGVAEVIAITPPAGTSDAVLAACALAGVSRLFRLGGAHGVAALAYGTATVPRVDKIVGPGNRWVAEAKRQLVGVVGIDMVAGPTEVLIIADQSAEPAHVAADLLAQAEHDEDAHAWLVTPSEVLADAVDAELARQLARLPRAPIAGRSLERNGLVVLVPDLATAVAVANLRAAEHVELLVRDASGLVEAVRHAGAIFVGAATPEPVGDYLAGPSHVLPTGGTARFASPLGVYDFVKRTSIIEYSAGRLAADAEDIIVLAEVEGLAGHAAAVRVRLAGRERRPEV